MRTVTTRGDICLKGSYGFIYKVADISYTEREDESFVYEIRPNYSVISLLGPEDFQGIPGLNLDLRKESYVRENRIPVFISERSPGRNREDLWDLLKKCKMEYLNQLEWLIRTDTQYPGDKLFVQVPQDKTIEVDSLRLLGNRSAIICRKALETICYGGSIVSPELRVDDTNRKVIFELLVTLYGTERKYLDEQRSLGIANASKSGNYKGRKRICVEKLLAEEIFHHYQKGEMNSRSAADALSISQSTFLRRYGEYLHSQG